MPKAGAADNELLEGRPTSGRLATLVGVQAGPRQEVSDEGRQSSQALGFPADGPDGDECVHGRRPYIHFIHSLSHC